MRVSSQKPIDLERRDLNPYTDSAARAARSVMRPADPASVLNHALDNHVAGSSTSQSFNNRRHEDGAPILGCEVVINLRDMRRQPFGIAGRN
jgi:hypothetical protein